MIVKGLTRRRRKRRAHWKSQKMRRVQRWDTLHFWGGSKSGTLEGKGSCSEGRGSAGGPDLRIASRNMPENQWDTTKATIYVLMLAIVLTSGWIANSYWGLTEIGFANQMGLQRAWKDLQIARPPAHVKTNIKNVEWVVTLLHPYNKVETCL